MGGTPLLTPEFAQDVELPLRPWKRDEAVRGILDDPEYIGVNTRIYFNEWPEQFQDGRTYVEYNLRYAVYPFLGRSALKKIAQFVQR